MRRLLLLLALAPLAACESPTEPTTYHLAEVNGSPPEQGAWLRLSENRYSASIHLHAHRLGLSYGTAPDSGVMRRLGDRLVFRSSTVDGATFEGVEAGNRLVVRGGAVTYVWVR